MNIMIIGNGCTLVLAETAPSALEIADRLGIELLIVTKVGSRCKAELFSGDVLILICHNYFAPILILGSMIP